jgi:hypothetical protein
MRRLESDIDRSARGDGIAPGARSLAGTAPFNQTSKRIR